MSDDRKIKHRKVDKEGKGGEPLPKSINPSDEVADQQAKPQSAGVFASGWYWLFAIASLAVVAVFTVYKPQASMDGHDIARAEPKASKLSSIAGSSQERVFAVYPGDRLFTQDELTKLGSNAKRIHLGILGRVYDVTKGLKYYGPEGGYSFFAGRDATRSFVSGDFSDSGLTDDLEGLSIREYLGIADWVGTYEKEYTYVGRLIGRFHNENGEPTVALLDAEEKIRLARELQAEEEDRNKLFPPCNSRWAAGKGEVWCSDKRYLSTLC